MNDPKTKIQESFHSLLDGNVTISGSSIPVGDKMDPPDGYPQIVLSDWTEVDDSDKTDFINELTFTVHVYDRTGSQSASRSTLYSIVDQIKGQLRTRPQSVDLGSNFHLIRLIVDNEISLPKELTDTHITFGRQIRFRMNVQQLN